METLKTLRQGARHYANWDKIIFKSSARSSPWFLPESNCKKSPLLLIGFTQVLKLHDDYFPTFYTTAVFMMMMMMTTMMTMTMVMMTMMLLALRAKAK